MLFNFLKKILALAKTIVILLLLVFITILMINNREIVAIRGYSPILPFEFQAPIFVVIFVFFVFGFLCGYLLFGAKTISKKIFRKKNFLKR